MVGRGGASPEEAGRLLDSFTTGPQIGDGSAATEIEHGGRPWRWGDDLPDALVTIQNDRVVRIKPGVLLKLVKIRNVAKVHGLGRWEKNNKRF